MLPRHKALSRDQVLARRKARARDKLRARRGRIGVTFVLFGAEELGLYGSRYYVENLSEAERHAIVAMINLDMVGVGQAWRFGGSDDLVQDALGAANDLGERAPAAARTAQSGQRPRQLHQRWASRPCSSIAPTTRTTTPPTTARSSSTRPSSARPARSSCA